MRFHVIGLPGSRITNAPHDSNPCDTMSYGIRGIVRILFTLLGHEVVYYGGADSDVDCTERVNVEGDAFQKVLRRDWDPMRNATRLRFDRTDPLWIVYNAATIAALAPRLAPRDFILIQGGHPQTPIAEAFPAQQSVEWLIGYDGSFAPFRVFQTYSHMHVTYGRQGITETRDFDAAGFGFFYRPEEFPRAERKGDYLLFMGRLNRDKGPHVAAQVAKHLGLRLLVAGQDAREVAPGRIVGNGVVIEAPRLEYVGVVAGAERARLLGEALALLCPTRYMEPFCSVSMEANLCGTPVIAPDHSCFTETVVEGVNGFRCRSFREYVEAVPRAAALDPAAISARAWGLYHEDVLARKYQAYFERLSTLWDGGWYELSGRTAL